MSLDKLYEKIYIIFCFLIAFRYKVKILTKEQDLQKAYRLRKKIFCDFLNWTHSYSNCETDEYDKHAIHFAVFKKNKIMAYCRIILSKHQFMIEKDFQNLIKGATIKKDSSTAEISRLTLDKKLIGTKIGKVIQAILYKKLLQWSANKNIKFWYCVVRQEFFNQLQKIVVCKQVGQNFFYKKNNTNALTIIIDLKKSLEYLRKNHKIMYLWYKV